MPIYVYVWDIRMLMYRMPMYAYVCLCIGYTYAYE